MGRHAQVVIGPAGSGKSTYCRALQQHCACLRRTVHVVNMDPAAEDLKYEPFADIRDLITVEDVMEEQGMGPNGALLYCLEYLAREGGGWLDENVTGCAFDDDYLLLDMPGQVELLTHAPVLPQLANCLQQAGYFVVTLCLVDCQVAMDPPRLVTVALTCLSAMLHSPCAHLNVMTKCDLLPPRMGRRHLRRVLSCDFEGLGVGRQLAPRHRRLTEVLAEMTSQFDLVGYVALDLTKEQSIARLLALADTTLQYGEDREVTIRPELEQIPDDD